MMRQQNANFQSDQDLEGQLSKNEGIDSGENKDLLEQSNATWAPGEKAAIQTYLYTDVAFLQRWNMVFVVSCVIAVFVDPLFLYVPVIDEVKKCIELDKTLRIVTICLRAVTDLIYLVNAILHFYIENATQKHESSVTDAWKTARRYLRWLIDILALLPLPQVVIPLLFTKVRGLNYLNTRILLDFSIVFQYVPRVLRLYLSQKELTKTTTNVEYIIWAKAAFKFSLYILASHVMGAGWYLFSIEREIACWHIACENHIGCVRSSFMCDTSLENYTFLNDFCTVNARDTMLFDFGMFLEALQTGVLESRDFPQKFIRCFWWGLRNLSSLGQNLQTSTYFWENCFAVFISIFGLLVFLSLIGALQTFIQLGNEGLKNIYIEKMEIKWKNKEKEHENKLREQVEEREKLREKLQKLREKLREKERGKRRKTKAKQGNVIGVKNPLHCLPAELKQDILHKLKKVSTFGKMDKLLDAMCDHLKPVLYAEKSYIVREGDPVVEILFILRGKLSIMTTNGGSTGFFNSEYLEAGNFCGQELLALCLDPHSSSSNLPISTRTVQAFSEVEAFALKADDLKFVVCKFHSPKAYIIPAVWRRYCKRKARGARENSTN